MAYGLEKTLYLESLELFRCPIDSASGLQPRRVCIPQKYREPARLRKTRFLRLD